MGTESGLPERVVADLYAVADVLFLPSRDEGFGIPALEAGLRRLPIVCSDLLALRDVAGDAALYISPDDAPDAVAQLVLARLDADPVARLAGRTRRQSSWETIYRESIGPLLGAAVVNQPVKSGAEAPSIDQQSAPLAILRDTHHRRSLRVRQLDDLQRQPFGR